MDNSFNSCQRGGEVESRAMELSGQKEQVLSLLFLKPDQTPRTMSHSYNSRAFGQKEAASELQAGMEYIALYAWGECCSTEKDRDLLWWLHKH